ncbi:DNA/RNA helicase domain-containing protein [Bradyrhizobium erythrophlei]|uniref:DNA/RNA helicase domain-containing protein n=1 Tax=Bradyrhizobium erythrophlei TaxID=1437360 RepID=UPI0035F0749B
MVKSGGDLSAICSGANSHSSVDLRPMTEGEFHHQSGICRPGRVAPRRPLFKGLCCKTRWILWTKASREFWPSPCVPLPSKGSSELYASTAAPDAEPSEELMMRENRRVKMAVQINVHEKTEATTWFLNGRDDVRSSYYMEDPATAFDIQGLELDWVGVCCDADFRSVDGRWQFYRFSGTRWQNVNDDNRSHPMASSRHPQRCCVTSQLCSASPRLLLSLTATASQSPFHLPEVT